MLIPSGVGLFYPQLENENGRNIAVMLGMLPKVYARCFFL